MIKKQELLELLNDDAEVLFAKMRKESDKQKRDMLIGALGYMTTLEIKITELGDKYDIK